MEKILKKTYLYLASFLIISLSWNSCAPKKWSTIGKKIKDYYVWYNSYFNEYFDANKLYEKHLKKYKEKKENTFSISEPPKFFYPIDTTLISTDSLKKAELIITALIQNLFIEKKATTRNAILDDSYLLLGNIRLQQGKYDEAIDAFHFTYTTFPFQDTHFEAIVGEAKAYLMMGNISYAHDLIEDVLKYQFKESEFKTRDEAYRIKLQAEVESNNVADFLVLYDASSKYKYLANINDESYKVKYFIAYYAMQTGRNELAKDYFKQVIKENDNDRYTLYSEIQYNTLTDSFDFEKLEDDLYDLLDLYDEEQNVFAWDIYYFFALKSKNQGDSILARKYADTVINNTKSNYIKSMSFQILGDLSIQKKDFIQANSFYSKALDSLPETKLEYATIFEKKKNLQTASDLLLEKSIDEKLLTGKTLSNEEKKFLYKLKNPDIVVKEKPQKKKKEKLEKKNKIKNYAKIDRLYFKNMTESFYFYNTRAVRKGFVKFNNQYYQLAYPSENWKWKNSFSNNSNHNNIPEETQNTEDTVSTKKVKPKSNINRDSLQQELFFIKFRLANLYRDDFGLYKEAIDTWLEILNKINKENKMYLPTLYALFRCYKLTDMQDDAFKIRVKIVNSYPESIFAKKIKGVVGKSRRSEKNNYKEIYTAYQFKDYKKVITEGERLLGSAGQDLIPQVSYLVAMSKYKTIENFDLYSELEYLYYNYPNHPIKKRIYRQMLYLKRN